MSRVPDEARGPTAALTDLVTVPGGTVGIGSADGYPEEGPVRERAVAPFRLERHPVTNAQFARFVEATGYVTEAERHPNLAEMPDVDPGLLVPGALVFTPTSGPVPLDDWRQWWRFVPGACWHRPAGPGSTVADRPDHPVVQVSWQDAASYTRWAGRRLPTEVELEYAMRAGHPTATYAWGEEERPGGRLMANTWQGAFPYRNTGAAGWTGTSPVGTFPANPLGLVDLVGNVWEWTTTLYATGPERDTADDVAARAGGLPTGAGAGPGMGARECGAGGGEAGASEVGERDLNGTAPPSGGCCPHGDEARLRTLASLPGEPTPRRVVKGGSHLCAAEYCHRYRPAARQGQAEDTASSHLGFRCAL